jgi:hypothetical protein
MLVAIVVLDLV